MEVTESVSNPSQLYSTASEKLMDRNREYNRRRSRSRSPPPRGGEGTSDRFDRNMRDGRSGYGSHREISGRDIGRDRDGNYDSRDSYGRDVQGGRDRDNKDRYRDRERRDRDRSRSRDRDRDRVSYRDRQRDSRDRDHFRDRNDSRYSDNVPGIYDACKDPTCTVIVKGLAPRTTEPTLFHLLQPYSPKEIRLITSRDTGECKGYAFIEFYSVEYSQYFHDSFAGSTGKGDANAPQFIVDNRAVSIGYVPDGHVNDWYRHNTENSQDQSFTSSRCDWICNLCKCQNFARREVCFKCSNPRNEQCVSLNSDPYNDSVISSNEPSTTLVAKGLSISATELDIHEAFRQYALVKNVTIVRDPLTQISKGLALIEFNNIQYATHTLNAAQNMLFQGRPLKVSYAKSSFVTDTIAFAQQRAFQVQYAAAAMQAAQWSQQQTDQNANAAAYQAAKSAHQNRLSAGNSSTAVAHAAGVTAQPKSIWPPCFETQGGSYLFQPNTGMFYESATNFFYCPKSKLYYNGHDGSYYKYDPSLPTPFVLFQPPLPTVDKTVEENDTIVTEIEPTEKEKKPVSLSLSNDRRAKVAKMFGAAIEEEEPVIVNTVPAQHIPAKGRAMNDAERKVAEANAMPKSLAAHRRATMLPKHTRPSGPREIDRPAEGTLPLGASPAQPIAVPATAAAVPADKIICFLCRRAFNSHEMLARHERESQLHAENLAKLALSQGQGGEAGVNTEGTDASAPSASNRPSAADIISGGFVGSSGAVYKDRAAERRAQSGIGVGNSDPTMMKRDDRDRDKDDRWRTPNYDTNKFSRIDASLPPGMSAEQAAKVYEDEDNVGNVMLRKMGWDENRGLGKDGSGIHNPVSLEGSKIGNDKSGVGTVEQNIPKVAYHSSGPEYKESLLRATQARFEQVEKRR